MPTKLDIRQDEELPGSDPGNVLRRHLSDIEVPTSEGAIGVLGNILYTADERNILPFRLDAKDALLVWAMVELAKTLGADDADEIRM